MEANVHCSILWPHRAWETIVTQWKNVQQRVLRDTAGPHGMQEIILIEWKIMDSSVHWFTVEPHGRLETIVTQWKQMAQMHPPEGAWSSPRQ